ncbi:concanavalin A-like lectin/glucanase domain-containing protein [Chytridium lagenaria]|nr:concanavalin A-like lectin/glucanase domain-containing protein [Chytridium lagenaria]
MTRPLVLVACLVAVVATAVNAADLHAAPQKDTAASQPFTVATTANPHTHSTANQETPKPPATATVSVENVINADSYNGNPDTADWLAEPRGLQAGNIKFGQYGGVMLSLSPTSNNPAVPFKKDANGNYPTALGARLSSTSYMLYGTFRARYIASPAEVWSQDEIDWETTGRDIDRGQSNFFYRGVVDYTKSSFHPTGTDTSRVYHDYEIRWAEDSITWVLDGEIVRIVNKEDTCSGSTCAFPSTPSKIEIAIWDGGAGSAGTRDWAGGYVPWDQTDASGYNVTYQYIMIQCNGDPVPTGPPRRTKGPNYSAPSLKEPVINVAAPGVAGYDESLMNSTGSVYTQQQKVNAGIINSTSKSDASVVRGRSVVGALSSVVVIGLGVGLFGLI